MNKFLMLPTLLLAACVSQPEVTSTPEQKLSVHGDSFQVVDNPKGCNVLVQIVGEAPFGTRKAQAHDAAIHQAKTQAIAAGANAIYFEKTHSKIWGSTVLASALLCEGNRAGYNQLSSLDRSPTMHP